MQSISPVLTEEFVEREIVIALDQPEYAPIIALQVPFTNKTVGLSVRFQLTDEERKAIAEGADLVLTEVTLTGTSFVPISLDVCMPNTNPFKG